MNLKGKAALITGGKRVGLAVARELAAQGVDVALTYARSKPEADEGALLVRAAGRRAVVLQADLSDPSACARVVQQTVAELGRLDILINMASVYSRKPFDALTVADWDAPMHIDVRAAFLCSKAAAPHMRAQGGGRIILFGDWIARSGRPRYEGFVPYYVAKAAAIALTEALALELAADNVLVNCVAPGPILAPPGTSGEEVEKVEQATPLGRWGGGGEIAKAILACLDSDFITGETLRVDGGRHLK